MEREHKKYFIISGIAYLLSSINFKFIITTIFFNPAYAAFLCLQLLILVLAFIFGIRNSVRGIVIWLGFLSGDFMSQLYRAILSIYSLEWVNIFYFALITVAIVYGFKSLNVNTIVTENFSKMYRKPAIVFFVCSILLFVIIRISKMENLWVIKDKFSEGMLHLYIFNLSLMLIIEIGVMIIAIMKIVKRETFGFVFTAVLLVWRFDYFTSIIIDVHSFSSVYNILQNDVINSNPILSFLPKILLAFEPHILVFMFLFLLIPLTNFLFYLKRDPELIPIKSNDVKPLSGAIK